jgi:hypothetical protein
MLTVRWIGHAPSDLQGGVRFGLTSAGWDAVRGFAVYLRARIGRGTSAQGFSAQQLRFRDLLFDVGANAGQHTAMMLKRGARVVAIEPQSPLAAD